MEDQETATTGEVPPVIPPQTACSFCKETLADGARLCRGCGNEPTLIVNGWKFKGAAGEFGADLITLRHWTRLGKVRDFDHVFSPGKNGWIPASEAMELADYWPQRHPERTGVMTIAMGVVVGGFALVIMNAILTGIS